MKANQMMMSMLMCMCRMRMHRCVQSSMGFQIAG